MQNTDFHRVKITSGDPKVTLFLQNAEFAGGDC